MRKMLFRGKHLKKNYWVYGEGVYLDQDSNTCYIIGKETCKVNPDTVGEYTGIIYNGQRIFEKDKFGVFGNTYTDYYVVEYEDGMFIALDIRSGYANSLIDFLNRYSPVLVGNTVDSDNN